MIYSILNFTDICHSFTFDHIILLKLFLYILPCFWIWSQIFTRSSDFFIKTIYYCSVFLSQILWKTTAIVGNQKWPLTIVSQTGSLCEPQLWLKIKSKSKNTLCTANPILLFFLSSLFHWDLDHLCRTTHGFLVSSHMWCVESVTVILPKSVWIPFYCCKLQSSMLLLVKPINTSSVTELNWKKKKLEFFAFPFSS